MSWTFLITSFIVCVVPGTGSMLCIAAALNHGLRAGMIAAFASTLGVVPHALAAITGVGALLHASPVAFAIVKYAGVGYLLYLAWGMWRDRSELVAEPGLDQRRTRTVIRDGVVLNLLNPKLTAFFFAFLPQFVSSTSGAAFGEMALLSLVFFALTFVVFAAYAALAAGVRRRILDRPSVVYGARRVFALCFVALSAKLAVG